MVARPALALALAFSILPASGGGSGAAGPWRLLGLPGMGDVTWRCVRGSGLPALGVDARTATADEYVTLRARGRVIATRHVFGRRLELPALAAPRQRLVIVQGTEPGTLRAVIDVDFRARAGLPSHCYPYLPPGVVLHLYPR